MPKKKQVLSTGFLKKHHRLERESPEEFPDAQVPGLRARLNRGKLISFVLTHRRKGDASVRRVTLGKFPTMSLEQAREAALEMKKELAKPTPAAPALREPKSFSALFPDYLAFVEAKRKPSTHKEYSRLWQKEIEREFGKTQVDAVDREMIERWHAAFADRRHGKPRPYVGNRALSVMSSFLTWCEKPTQRYRARGTNPAMHFSKADERHPERDRERYLSDDELARLGSALAAAALCGLPPAPAMAKKSRGMSHARKAKLTGKSRGPYKKHEPYHLPASPVLLPMSADQSQRVALDVIEFLLLSGWRVSEAVNLTWREVDLTRSLARLRDSKSGPSGRPIGEAAMAVIRRQPLGGKADRVFETGSLNRVWQAVRHAAGISDARLHDLRHTFATYAVDGGTPANVAGHIIGHRDSKSINRYTHIRDARARVAVDSTSQTLSSLLGDRDSTEQTKSSALTAA